MRDTVKWWQCKLTVIAAITCKQNNVAHGEVPDDEADEADAEKDEGLAEWGGDRGRGGGALLRRRRCRSDKCGNCARCGKVPSPFLRPVHKLACR